MRRLLSIFLHAFLLDAVLSVLNEWLPITSLRTIVALAALVLALGVYACAAFSSRMPMRFVLPAVGFLVWANFAGGFPLGFVMPQHSHIFLCGLQLILAITLWILHRRWRRTPPDPFAREFSWRRLVPLAALGAITTPLLLSAGMIQTVGTYLEARSGGYFKLRPGGLLLEEREFTKDGRKVRLVSMIHIGEKDFYDNIYSSLPANGSAAVLLEGITDDTDLLKNRFSYSGLAGMLGLTSQESSELQNSISRSASEPDEEPAGNPRIHYFHADVDVSVFNPSTLDFINSLGLILSSPTFGDAIQAMREMNAKFDKPGVMEAVMHDILDKRNDHLVARIDRALETSQTVSVPWGALHLPYIENALKERGFTETHRSAHTAVHFLGSRQEPAGQ